MHGCVDGTTAYVSLLTMHRGNATSTFIAKHTGGRRTASRLDSTLHMQAKLVLVLVRSLRWTERCRRDFVLLLGGGVALRDKDRSDLEAEGTRFVTMPAPVVRGVPSMDKLHALHLTSYSRLLVLDADIMVLQSLDSLLTSHAPPGQLTMGHHPYDLQQSACAIPVEARGVGGMLVFQPSSSTYEALVAYIVRKYDAPHLAHYSEQTGVACFAHERRALRTLLCSFLYDVAVGEMSTGRGGRLGSCKRFSGFPASACEQVEAHLRSACPWAAAAPHVRAIHFKGKLKPWHHRDPMRCLPLRRGRLRVGPRAGVVATRRSGLELDARVLIGWVPSLEHGAGRCEVLGGASAGGHGGARDAYLNVSLTGRAVVFATGKAVPRVCCRFETLVQGEWYATIHNESPRRDVIVDACVDGEQKKCPI